MTTIKLTDCGIDPALCRAVIRQIGTREALEDVAKHGAGGGFPGFTYHSDTVPFFRRHRKAIVGLVERMADDLGENPADMVAGFQCLGGQQRRDALRGEPERNRREALREYLPSVSRCLYGGRLTDDDTQVANALTWFALEEVARALNPDP